MIVRDANRLDIRQVAENMREADAREIFAGRWDDDPEALVNDLLAARPLCTALKALCVSEWAPVAIIGAFRRSPTVLETFMFATPAFPAIGRQATRWVKRIGFPCYVDPWGRRSQCCAWEGNAVSRAWLEELGYEAEGVLRAFGKNGEHFVQYARLAKADPFLEAN